MPALRQLVKYDTVGSRQLHGRAVHGHKSVLQIDLKESHGVGLMVQRHQKFIVGKDLRILGELAADRQAEILGQQAVFFVQK